MPESAEGGSRPAQFEMGSDLIEQVALAVADEWAVRAAETAGCVRSSSVPEEEVTGSCCSQPWLAGEGYRWVCSVL